MMKGAARNVCAFQNTDSFTVYSYFSVTHRLIKTTAIRQMLLFWAHEQRESFLQPFYEIGVLSFTDIYRIVTIFSFNILLGIFLLMFLVHFLHEQSVKFNKLPTLR